MNEFFIIFFIPIALTIYSLIIYYILESHDWVTHRSHKLNQKVKSE